MKLPFCFNCMPNSNMRKSFRGQLEVPEISDDILEKSFDSKDTTGLKGLSFLVSNNAKLPEVKSNLSTAKKIPKGLRMRLKSSKKSIMRSYKKLEILKNGLEKDENMTNQSHTIGKEGFASMMAKRLRNRKSESLMSRNSKMVLHHTQIHTDMHHDSGRRESIDSQNQGGILPNKNKFKIRKVRRKTNMGLTNQYDIMNLTKIIKKKKISIDSSSEDFSRNDKTSSGEQTKKIREEGLPKIDLNKSSL